MPPVFVGIDVAKDGVVIALAPTGEQWASPTARALDADAVRPGGIVGVLSRGAAMPPCMVAMSR